MLNGVYGIEYNPFEPHATSPDKSFKSNDFNQMVSRLNFIKESRGVGVFTAPPGYGKTFALRCFADSLNPNLFQMAYICLTTVSVTEFYRQFCYALNIESSAQRSAMFKAIQERVLLLFKEKRRPFIIAIDEAHDMDPRALRDIKMLMNHAFDSFYCFTLLLIGEPHLNSILTKPVHEALFQRITIHYNFTGLSADETNDYIRHKISAAGGCTSIIADGVTRAVYGLTRGNPRLIDNIMSDALTLGSQLNKPLIDDELILAAAENQSFQ